MALRLGQPKPETLHLEIGKDVAMSAQPQFLDNAAIAAKFREINARYPGWHAQALIRESLHNVLGGIRDIPLSEQLPRLEQRRAWFAEVDRLLALRTVGGKSAHKVRKVGGGDARQIDLEEAIAGAVEADIAQDDAAESMDAGTADAAPTPAGTIESAHTEASGEVAPDPASAARDPETDLIL
jgi:hypothetical protein